MLTVRLDTGSTRACTSQSATQSTPSRQTRRSRSSASACAASRPGIGCKDLQLLAAVAHQMQRQEAGAPAHALAAAAKAPRRAHDELGQPRESSRW